MEDKISVIIPAYNEKERIGSLLKKLKSDDESVQVIVADGESTDGTPSVAKAYGAETVSTTRSRGLQMDRGVEMAEGTILLFLHSDTVLPKGWYDIILSAFSNGGENKVAGGAFSFAVDADEPKYRLLEKLVALRNKYLGLTYGDQAIFVKKENFLSAGGYKGMPIMEDVDLVRRIRKHGEFKILKEKALTSARRWQKKGLILTSLRNLVLLTLYYLGLRPEKIYRLYYD